MELNILKMVFFFGEEEQIDTFIGTLKPRCIKETNKSVTLDDGSVSRLVYNTENSSYIDQYMNSWQWCDHCQKMYRVSEEFPKKVHIYTKQQRIERVGLRNMRQQYETICPNCDHVVPCYEADGEYIYLDNARTCKFYSQTQTHYTDLKFLEQMKANNELRNVFSPNELVTNSNVTFSCMLVTTDVPLSKVLYRGTVYFVRTSDVEEYFDHNYWQECSSCHVWNLKSNMTSGQCANCQITIYDYHSWSGSLEFLKTEGEDTEMFFGIELETEGNTDNKVCVAPYQDLFHLERDGSLGQGGFEIISQPMTYDFILSQQERIKAMFDDLVRHGQRSHDSNNSNNSNCGLHIHVSYKAFNGDNAVNRAIAIVNGMQGNIMNFARRSGNHYCNYRHLPFNFTLSQVLNCVDDRYDCVNQQNAGRSSKNTIEFRMFRGTLNFTTFLASITLVKNIVEQANKLDKLLVSWKELVKDEVCQQYLTERRERGGIFDNQKHINFSYYYLEDLQNKFLSQRLSSEEYIEAITKTQTAFVENYQALIGGDM